ncbi:hypothetical protein [Sphaerochaeta sp.]|uniref:hypothetical protein n=1 Tax=Sphaerochaeta sp. TaxID=1972642 RepID=UPI0025870FB1|nr:hypothetical protein [Sphaerochaeta sp.]MDD3456847.1 hypothetical protein [Sphaerochaeta sp.]
MRRKTISLCISMLMVILFGGCVSSEAITLRITDPVSSRTLEQFYEPQVPSQSPEKALNTIDHYYFKNYSDAFTQAISLGNYFLSTWYGTDYAAQLANRMAWMALFLVDEKYTTFKDYEENIYNFCRAMYYANKSIEYDKNGNYYWVNAGADLKDVIINGYRDPLTLSDYLRIKRLIYIEIPNKRDLKLVEESINGLQAIIDRKADWIPEIVQTNLQDQKQFYKEKTR